MSYNHEIIAQTNRYYLVCKNSDRKVHNLVLVDRRTGNYEIKYLFNEVRSWDRLFFSPRMKQSLRDNLPRTITSAISDVINNESLHRRYDGLIEKLVR